MAIDELTHRPWLLLPGTMCTGAVFDPFLDALSVPMSNRRYVTLDRPSVTDYAPSFEGVDRETVVCGFSLGAIVAAHAAHMMTPHSLILFALNPHADDPGRAQARRDLARDVTSLGGAAALAARNLDLYGPDPDATRGRILGMADQTASLIEPQTELALSRPGALSSLAKASAPVFTLTGTCDRAAPPAQGRAAAEAAPVGQFCGLEGLGHFAILEDPETCADAVMTLQGSRDARR